MSSSCHNIHGPLHAASHCAAHEPGELPVNLPVRAVLCCAAHVVGRIVAIDIDPTRPNAKREHIVGVLQESEQLAADVYGGAGPSTTATVSAGAGVPSHARAVWLVPMDPKLPARLAVDLPELWGRPEVDELIKEARGEVQGR